MAEVRRAEEGVGFLGRTRRALRPLAGGEFAEVDIAGLSSGHF